MEWIINQLRVHPELAIFLTLFAGFWLGRLKIGKFSLGTVTSVLLVGVLVGQLNITVDGPLKAVFFLLFFVSRWLQGRSAILSRTEKRRTATGGIRRIDVYRQSGSTMDTCQDYGISYRRGCRIAGRLTNDICRYRCGKRYDQPVGHQRSTEGNIY